MRLFGWFREDPNAPPPPPMPVKHYWLRRRFGNALSAPTPRWVNRVVRCKPTHIDLYRGVATIGFCLPNLHKPFGQEWSFEPLTFKQVHELFEPVSQEENDYLEERVEAYHKEEARMDLAAFYAFAGIENKEAYLARFPRPKVWHAEGVDNIATKEG